MKRELVGIMLLIIFAGVSGFAQLPATRTRKPEPKETRALVGATAADVRISKYEFPPPDAKSYAVNRPTSSSDQKAGSVLIYNYDTARATSGNAVPIPNRDKVVLVHIINAGNSPPTECRLMLTITKINGVATNREKVVTVSGLAPHKDVWLMIDATGILPRNVELEATSFKLTLHGRTVAGGIIFWAVTHDNDI